MELVITKEKEYRKIDWCWMIILISFVGFLVENIWNLLTSGQIDNRNMHLPFILGYGLAILGVYLLRVVNPKVDRFIDWIKSKWKSIIILRGLTVCLIIFLFIDFGVSGYAIYAFLIKSAVEKNIAIPNIEEAKVIYRSLYDDEEKSNLINKYFSPYKMLRTYPNLTITLEDGTIEKIKKYYPERKTYYYDFNVEKNI